ncbi:MAG: tyrosine-type recombinase/integrase [Pseudobdellovibrionaceae bacterium]
MAIKTWIEEGKVHYNVKVKARSKIDRDIQPQKAESGILKDVTVEQFEAGLPEEARKKLQRIEIRLYGDARAEVAQREGAGILWQKLVDRYEKEVLEDPDVLEFMGLGERAANGYLTTLRDHTDTWDKRAASEITSADFELLVVAMRKTGYSNSTIYNVKSAINSCFKWGMKKRLIPRITLPPTYGCMISRKNSRRPEVLNYSQICHLLQEAEERKHPWYPVWKLVLYTGFRSGEAYALKRKDLDREEARIMLDTKYAFDTRKEEELKDHEWRQVPINQELDRFFAELGVWEMGPNEYVMPRIQAWKNGEAARIIRAFCEEIEVTSICFHTLRACWATQLLRNGVAQAKVMIMGGWADLETMQAYLRRAGVEIEGATDSLNFERKRERPARVLKMVPAALAAEHLEGEDDSA